MYCICDEPDPKNAVWLVAACVCFPPNVYYIDM